MTVMQQTFGNLVQRYMSDAGLSGSELAALVGTTESTISRIRNDRTAVDHDIAVAIAECLRIHDNDRRVFLEAAAATHIPAAFKSEA